jgi:outer membrane protein
MRKMLVALVAVVFAVSMFAVQAAYAKEYKMGYVDLARVFDEYKKTKESEKSLEDKGKVKEAERKKLVDELRKLKDEQALLSEKAKGDKQKVIDEKIQALQEFDKKAQGELMKERNDLLGGIMKDIEKVIALYAKEAGYDFILNSRTLLYGGDQYDVTNEVLTRLNK